VPMNHVVSPTEVRRAIAKARVAANEGRSIQILRSGNLETGTDHIVSVSARVHVLYIFRRGGNRKRQQCIIEPRIYRRISFPPFSVAERYIPSLSPPLALRSGLDTAHHKGCH
jgi:hypothetical protein